MTPGQYDARARVLIRHVSCLLRVSPQQLEEFEETLGEQLREAGEESEWVVVGWDGRLDIRYESVANIRI